MCRRLRHPDLSKSAGSTDYIPTFRVSRNQGHDVHTLLLAKKLVRNCEISRRAEEWVKAAGLGLCISGATKDFRFF